MSRFNADNHFMKWILQLHHDKKLQVKLGSKGTRDIILTPEASKRFALSIIDQKPCIAYIDKDALEFVKWTSAAILFGAGQAGEDMVALSATDARPIDSNNPNPVATRLFIPISRSRLAVWKKYSPQEIALTALEGKKNGGYSLRTPPFKILPLKI